MQELQKMQQKGVELNEDMKTHNWKLTDGTDHLSSK